MNFVRRTSARRRHVLACIALALGALPASASVRFHPQRPTTPQQFVSPHNLCANQVPAESAYIRCRKPVYDFGRLPGGPNKSLWHIFEIENICDKSVQVHVVESCACRNVSNVEWIRPGESRYVSVTTSLKHDGRLTKQLEVHVITIADSNTEVSK